MGDRVELLGVKETQAQLDAIGTDITESGAKAGKQAALLVARAAAGIGASRSGRLGGSYRGLGSKRQGRVVSKLVYAPIIEFGWPRHGIAAQERVLKAIRQNERAIQAIYERYCRDVIAAKGGGR